MFGFGAEDRSPYKYYEANLLWMADNRILAGYVLPLVSYVYLDQLAQRRVHDAEAHLFWQTLRWSQWHGVNRNYSTAAYAESLRNDLFTTRHRAAWSRWCAEAAQHLGEHMPQEREVYLIVEIPFRPMLAFPNRAIAIDGHESAGPDDLDNLPASSGLFSAERRRGWGMRWWRWGTEAARRFTGLADEITQEAWNQACEAEWPIFAGIQRSIPQVRRMDTRDWTWLIRRAFYRGIGEPPPRNVWTPALMAYLDDQGQVRLAPRKKELSALWAGRLRDRLGSIAITHADNQVSYQRFAVAAMLPPRVTSPGMEYLHMLSDLPFPVDWCLHVKAIQNREAMAVVRREQERLQDQVQNIDRAVLPQALIAAADDIAHMESVYSDPSGEPLVEAWLTFIIAAPDPKLLRHRVEALTDRYRGLLDLEFPHGEQYQLFLQTLPGMPVLVDDYSLPMEPGALAAGGLRTTDRVGDYTGPFIGWTVATARRQPVLLDLPRLMLVNKPANMALIGEPGTGKSVAMKLLDTLYAYRGARLAIVDPKNEYPPAFAVDETLRGAMRVVDTLGYATGGRTLDIEGRRADIVGLTPCGIAGDDRQLAREIAQEYLELLLGLSPEDLRYGALMTAMEQWQQDGALSLRPVIDWFLAPARVREEQNLGQLLAQYARMPLGRLAFAEAERGDRAVVTTLLNSQINIFPILSLKIQRDEERGRQPKTTTQLLSEGHLYLIGRAFERLMHLQTTEPKIFQFDEAWKLAQVSQGRQVLSSIGREGRWKKASLIVASQYPWDLADYGLEASLPVIAIFRAEKRRAAELSLELLGLDKGRPGLVDEVLTLATGQCLLRDADGRVGRVQITPVPSRLLDAFNSTPTFTEDTYRLSGAGNQLTLPGAGHRPRVPLQNDGPGDS